MPDLTFAAAMELDQPLEVQDRCGNWVAFYPCGQYQPAFLAKASFRLRRPRRSRVQEMADTLRGTAESAENYTERVIHAVIQFVRELNPGNFRTGQIATDIEREFLELR